MVMNKEKQRRLEEAGWAVGTASEFLELSEEESRYVEMKLSLAAAVRELRERQALTQTALARTLGSSQSRVAKMEAADRSVSMDLMVRSLLRIGATPAQIATWIRRAEDRRAA